MHAESDVVMRMTRCFEEQDAAAVIAFEEVPENEVIQYGIAKPASDDEVFRILDLVEKPSSREAPSRLAIAARYCWPPGSSTRWRRRAATREAKSNRPMRSAA
jgi:UTP--glucose-1-phosphate uridylyltransferase